MTNETGTTTDWYINKFILLLKIALLIGAGLSFIRGNYEVAAITLGITFITFLPVVLGQRFRVKIPSEFELLAVVFIFASLFLGEVEGYYVRFWWWDIVLHTGAGFLFGILGFLLVHVLNEKKEIGLDLKPGFVALFAFVFALGFGSLWEIFEFTMDQLFGTNMQKSGLVDTMWDMIVNSIGALTISVLGWGYLKKEGVDSFLERWIQDFIKANPRFFKHRD
jgi:hypothetical protein